MNKKITLPWMDEMRKLEKKYNSSNQLRTLTGYTLIWKELKTYGESEEKRMNENLKAKFENMSQEKKDWLSGLR